MKIYLIAIDLDGTLLNSNKQISATTEDILRSAQREHGVKIVLATARPPRTVLPFHKRLNLDTPLICYNGALVFDPLSNAVLMHRPVPLKIARGVIAIAQRVAPNVSTSVELLDSWYTDHLDEAYLAGTGREARPEKVDSIEDALTVPVTRLVLFGPVEQVTALRQEIEANYPHQVILNDVQGKVLQVAHATTSKAAALRVVAGELSITRQQVMAIGDQMNDIEMLQWAGVGVAMGNAPPAVRAVADLMTDHHDSDGAARAIHNLIIQGKPPKPRKRK